MKKPLGIIGGGNMGEALIAGITQSGLLSASEILFFEPRADRRQYLQEKFQVSPAETNKDLVLLASTLILAVRPKRPPNEIDE